MKITGRTSSIRTLKQGDAAFTITDGIVTSPRAGFEISQRCPENYKDFILECIEHKWIKPVAYISEKELLFIGLAGK